MTGYAGEDTSLGVLTPEGVEFVLYPAGLPIRAFALGIDVLFQGAILIILLISAGIVGMVMGFWFTMIAAFLLNWFYHTFCEILFQGQSMGKRIMGIRVVRSDGSPVNPGASFLRNLLRFADTFLMLYLIAFLCMNISRGFRRIGDWAADTLVVYTAGVRGALKEPALNWLEDIKPLPPPRPLSHEEKQGVLLFARRYPRLGRARGDEIVRPWIETLRGDGEDENLDALSPSGYLLGMARWFMGGAVNSRGPSR
jgi:uncharacterized RDD family membrane protein YckC